MVNICPIHEGDNHPPLLDPICLRPLCAQDNVKPDSAPGYGMREDKLLHHIMGGPVFWPNPRLVDASLPEDRSGTGMLYVEPENLPLVAYEVRDGHLRGIRANAAHSAATNPAPNLTIPAAFSRYRPMELIRGAGSSG